MTKLYRLRIDPQFSLEKAWEALEHTGIEIVYGSEEESGVEIFVYVSSPEDAFGSYPWIEEYSAHDFGPIDWDAQWAHHGQNYRDGYVHIDLSLYGRQGGILRLQPGSGFGDLSHPTTRLMLEFLAHYLHQQVVIDIGCGSGILTIGAAVLGATHAYGIDLDIGAIEHSQQNARLNGVADRCSFSLPYEKGKWRNDGEKILIVMNMIASEQKSAWLTLQMNGQAECITSGIRVSERNVYLQQAADWGWTLQNEKEEMGWLVFYFLMSGANAKVIPGC